MTTGVFPLKSRFRKTIAPAGSLSTAMEPSLSTSRASRVRLRPPRMVTATSSGWKSARSTRT